MYTAKWNFKGNTKVGEIATFSKLAGDGIFQTKFGEVQGTCVGACEYCGHAREGHNRPDCFVFKSYRYPSVVDGHAMNTVAMRNDPEKAFDDLSLALKRKRKPVTVGRYDQSGEIETPWEFFLLCKMAREHSEVRINFYLYSKKYNIVIPALLAGNVPENLTVNISIWHEQGIDEYNKVKHLANVKAFVCVDTNENPVDGWSVANYAEHGLKITGWCTAYNRKGKMNHDITCQKCGKCFDRNKSHKVNGTWAH